jgi:hypothetical protein
MITRPRRKLYTDVIPFPDTKSAGEATIQSDELYPFEGSAPGELNLQLTADDDSNITDTLTVDLNVSYDGGDSWLDVASYSDLANGTGDPISAFKSEALSYAPRVRLDGVFDGSGALASGHGIEVNADFHEGANLYRHEVDADVISVSTLGNSSSETGSAVQVNNSLYDSVSKILVVVYVGDTSKITDNVTWDLESSYDGSHWWTVLADQSDIANGTGSSFAETSATDDLGDYFRIVVSTDGTGEIAADHGIQFNLISLFG